MKSIGVKRRVSLTEKKSELTVILDFIWEDNRWQLIRENIFSNLLDFNLVRKKAYNKSYKRLYSLTVIQRLA